MGEKLYCMYNLKTFRLKVYVPQMELTETSKINKSEHRCPKSEKPPACCRTNQQIRERFQTFSQQ